MNTALSAWSNFYVITGGSAGALTGLTFVVITLIAGSRNRAGASEIGVGTFTSPTVVDFCVALYVSAALSAPWQFTEHASIAVRLGALFGIVYELLVATRMLHLTRAGRDYRPGWDDWLRYVAGPLAGYGLILGGALALPTTTTTAMFIIAAGTLVLIFAGIHNAWDVVTYLAITQAAEDEKP